jgi:hypothetical protein
MGEMSKAGGSDHSRIVITFLQVEAVLSGKVHLPPICKVNP